LQFVFAKDKVKPLVVIMDKPGQSAPVSVIHAAGESTVIVICEHLYDTWGRVPVINQLRLDFGAFSCNILGSDFVRLLLTVHTQNFFLAR
jgi:hypothetical protein